MEIREYWADVGPLTHRVERAQAFFVDKHGFEPSFFEINHDEPKDPYFDEGEHCVLRKPNVTPGCVQIVGYMGVEQMA